MEDIRLFKEDDFISCKGRPTQFFSNGNNLKLFVNRTYFKYSINVIILKYFLPLSQFPRLHKGAYLFAQMPGQCQLAQDQGPTIWFSE